jgi:AhpD family alkylhydroperoxidase
MLPSRLAVSKKEDCDICKDMHTLAAESTGIGMGSNEVQPNATCCGDGN